MLPGWLSVAASYFARWRHAGEVEQPLIVVIIAGASPLASSRIRAVTADCSALSPVQIRASSPLTTTNAGARKHEADRPVDVEQQPEEEREGDVKEHDLLERFVEIN